MKFQIKITSAATVEETEDYWTADDYVVLLDKFNYPNAEIGDSNTLKELLLMAITDYEPTEAATILLDYKLSEHLNVGQIHQISNDMLLDKISEEYPDISLHSTLFHINQLLFKAFNGKFPNTKATLIICSITPLEESEEVVFSKEVILKLLSIGLSEHTLIKRLFGDKLNENQPLPEAESIVWEAKTTDNRNFTIFTSDYWLHKEDLITDDFVAEYLELEKAK